MVKEFNDLVDMHSNDHDLLLLVNYYKTTWLSNSVWSIQDNNVYDRGHSGRTTTVRDIIDVSILKLDETAFNFT